MCTFMEDILALLLYIIPVAVVLAVFLTSALRQWTARVAALVEHLTGGDNPLPFMPGLRKICLIASVFVLVEFFLLSHFDI